MADRRHHAVANDWATKFYLTNATNHKFQSRRCVYLAIEMMFQALENEELPYFQYKGKPEFWAEFKKYWEDARNYMISTERTRYAPSAGINDKYPNTNKVEQNSRVLHEFWDFNPHDKLVERKRVAKLHEKRQEKVNKVKKTVLNHKTDVEL